MEEKSRLEEINISIKNLDALTEEIQSLNRIAMKIATGEAATKVKFVEKKEKKPGMVYGSPGMVYGSFDNEEDAFRSIHGFMKTLKNEMDKDFVPTKTYTLNESISLEIINAITKEKKKQALKQVALLRKYGISVDLK